MKQEQLTKQSFY